MEIKIFVELSTADGNYHFNIYVDEHFHDGGIVEVSSYSDAVEWIGNNMLNNKSLMQNGEN